MPTRSLLTLVALPLAAILALSGCGSTAAPADNDPMATGEPTVAAPAEPEPTESEPGETGDPAEAEPPAGTEGLSPEAIEQGFEVVPMPNGWPDDLPLPDGLPVSAFRSGDDFALAFDLASVSAGEAIFSWYQENGWSVEEDVETSGVRMMSFGSPEVNDYGPVRRITAGLGMTGWPTGFQYALTVQDQE